MSRLALGPLQQPPIQRIPGVLPPEVKQPGREANYTLHLVSRVWICTSVSQIHLRDMVLNKPMDSFRIYLINLLVEYTDLAVAGSRQGVFLQLGGWLEVRGKFAAPRHENVLGWRYSATHS